MVVHQKHKYALQQYQRIKYARRHYRQNYGDDAGYRLA
jgi:hypothetical protein